MAFTLGEVGAGCLWLGLRLPSQSGRSPKTPEAEHLAGLGFITGCFKMRT